MKSRLTTLDSMTASNEADSESDVVYDLMFYRLQRPKLPRLGLVDCVILW